MLFSLLYFKIEPFPERNDSITKNNKKEMIISASGTLDQWYDEKCHETFTENVFVSTKSDWCSNANKTKTDRPWISVAIKGKAMKLTGYSLRAGCSSYYCCCCTEDGKDARKCCCDLYSWSLQVSHNNVTWKTVHKVEKDKDFYGCRNRTYEIKDVDEYYEYVRLIQDAPWPSCDYCICINQLELYGTTISLEVYEEAEDSEESVSIIGKIKKEQM